MPSRKLVLSLTGLFYLVSVALPLVTWPGSDSGVPGYLGLLAGLLGILFMGGEGLFALTGICTPWFCGLSWLANITFFTAIGWTLVAPEHVRVPKILAGSTVVLATLFLPIQQIAMDDSGLRSDLSPGWGFYLWLASFILLNVYVHTKVDKSPSTAG